MTISTVTSEALQLKLRQLLPSQQGFGTDLSASDTIIPIIDLTAAAEGSDLGQNLQTAMSFGSQTSLVVNSTTTVAANTPGFYRLQGSCDQRGGSGSDTTVLISMSDGATTKTVNGLSHDAGGSNFSTAVYIDMTFFLNSGESCSIISSAAGFFTGSVRQIADVNGTLVLPSGFTPQ